MRGLRPGGFGILLLALLVTPPPDGGPPPSAAMASRGSLRIESDPAGARIQMDGEFQGTTPHVVEKALAGDRRLVLTFPGYFAWEGKVRIEAGETSRVLAVLDPKPGELTVLTSPPGGEIWIDGKVKGRTRWSGPVKAGPHQVEIRLEGHEITEETATVPPGGKRTVDILLQKGATIEIGGPNDPFIRRQDRLMEWPSAGDVEGPRGSPMVLVPAGEFLMGSAPEDRFAYAAEKPQRRVRLRAFLIDKYEVPNGLYRRFLFHVNRNGHSGCPQGEPEEKDHRPGTLAFRGREWNQARQPVTQVDWWDAAAFCAWAGKRLPTEAEWEKAARGTDGRVYPWGGERPGSLRHGNFADRSFRFRNPEWTWILEGYDDGFPGLAPVGSFPRGASPWGAEDMAGNVREWVQDRYDETYYRQAPAEDPPGPASGDRRVLRGGAWNDTDWELRSAARLGFPPGFRVKSVGFRCAMDAP